MSTPNHRDNRSHRATRRYLTNLFVLMVLMTLIVTSASAKPVSPTDSKVVNAFSIWLDGPIQAAPGELLAYNITTDVTDLFGAQLELSFDPAVLQVVGTQVTPGSCPKPDFVHTNSVDNGVGSISYVVTSLSPTVPCDGGIVASFQFQVAPAAAAGSTPVQFDTDKTIMADINGDGIPVTAVDLSLEIVGTTAEFSGTPTEGRAPLTVNFTNLSSGDYDACTWNFGHGSGSSLCENQSHVYTAPGTYTVELTVSGPTGSDSETKVDYIVVPHWLSLPIILR